MRRSFKGSATTFARATLAFRAELLREDASYRFMKSAAASTKVWPTSPASRLTSSSM